MRRVFSAIFAGICATCLGWLPSLCSADDTASDRAAAVQAQNRSIEEIFTTEDSARLGLRPPVASMRERLAPAYGLSYHRESKTLLMPLDEKREWTMGLNLNLNALPNADSNSSPPPTGLNLEGRRTPGFTFQKKF